MVGFYYAAAHAEMPLTPWSIVDKGVEVPLSRRYELLQPRTATEEELRTVHSERLVEFLKATEGEKDEEKLKNQSSK